MWTPGTTVTLQECWKDQVWAARPLRVVDDNEARALLWMPKGTVRTIPGYPEGADASIARCDRTIANLSASSWEYVEHVWDVSCLWVLEPNPYFGIWITWNEDHEHIGYYVNFQAPYVRTPIGIATMDYVIDIIVEPDLTWSWKDADEFEQIIDRSIFSTAVIDAVNRSAEEVIGRIERAAYPFDGSHLDFVPDPSWPHPELPSIWDVVYASPKD